jgi:hypothetical protein
MVITLTCTSSYPDIKQTELANFVSELMDLFKQYAVNDEYRIGLIMLEGLFDEALANDSLRLLLMKPV